MGCDVRGSLEPCDVKAASTVLRGGDDGNVISLPDVRHEVDLNGVVK
jgi:hypothetical protein